jgi:L-threonylcarbamoyladenylate synthase
MGGCNNLAIEQSTNLEMEFEKDILNCLDILRAEGVILYPTDTIWGIGCDATSTIAVKKIYALKERTDEKSMIVLVADEREVLKYTANPDLQVFDYLKSVSKPTTVIYDGAIGLAPNLIDVDGTVAIRICKEEFCRHLIKRFRRPIVSTSANISGEPFPKNFSFISDEIRNRVDYIVQYHQNSNAVAEPSALIRWKKGKSVVLRP